MNKILSVLCTVCLFLASAGLQAGEKVTIATGEYSPFSSEKIKHNGYVSHLISRAFEEQGITVKFKFLPWKRAYESTKNGDYDATSFWYDSEERRQDFYYSDPVSDEQTVFFYRKNQPLKDWNTVEDLKDFSVGATIGYTYTEEFWAASKANKIRVSETPADLTNMKKLIAGRIDLFPATMVMGNTLLHENFSKAERESIDYHKKPLTQSIGSLLFPKSSAKSERLMATFNEGLKKLSDSGELNKMYDDLKSGGYK